MEENEVVVDDRRAAIEEAFAAAEEPKVDAPVEKAAIEPTTIAPEASVIAAEASATDKIAEKAEPEAKPQGPQAPQSWKPAQRAKWDALDPEVKQEVSRRERETTQVLNETASARQLASHFQQTVQPYMARIQSLGAQPLQAVGELLKSDHILSTAPPAQRAQFMAKMINDYGIDIQALDAALAGKAQPDPVDTRVNQLLQERLAPFQTYLQQQQQREQQVAQRQAETLSANVEQMASDIAKFPHFEAVRNTMADAIEINSRRGNHLTLEQAYNFSVAMDPTLSRTVAAVTTNEQAQKALKASVSVGGAPTGSTGKKPDASDRRAIIEAAFDSVGGR